MARTQVTWKIGGTDAGQCLRVRRAQLAVISGPDKGASVEVLHRLVTVGAAPECSLTLSDPAVSRNHFEILPTETGYRLRDADSTNGTYLKELRVHDVVLRPQEEIRLGGTRLRFSLSRRHEEFVLSNEPGFGEMIGVSVAAREVFAVLEQASRSDGTLLLEGESGTGKELAAATVHRFSERRRAPLVVVDCGALSASLAESELFGHRKGAFTGAAQDRLGAFEEASGGTLFLDEVGELEPQLQPKLLRALESREVKRLGENSYRPVDIRLIVATNRDLAAEVQAGRFREDLFYRISVLPVRLPPLRERLEDLAPLARAFVGRLRPELDPEEVIGEEVLTMFMSHRWPGNLRELRNAVERLLLLPDDPEAALAKATGRAGGTGDLMQKPFDQARREWAARFERSYLVAMLEACGGSVARAAERAGIPRQSYYRLLKKYDIAPPRARGSRR